MSADNEDEREPVLEEQEGYVGEALSINLTFSYHGVLDGGAGDSAELVDKGMRIKQMIADLIETKLKEEMADFWSVKMAVSGILS